jgi:HlyD family secretion protein
MNAPTPIEALKPVEGAATEGELAALLDEPSAKPWYRRPALWIAAVSVALLIGGAAWWWTSRAASAAPSYTTQAVTRGNVTLTVTANGKVQPTRSINIGSELSGTVLKVNVDVNDAIKKGQILVVRNSSERSNVIKRFHACSAFRAP